ncbi:MAG: hypothetical protein JRN10_08420 [Nitrososphaerota archaeon]|jgi:hypothetical protein|nr:hypothetical protein [Nitrososphaerota archaeon]MDG6931242.1 hypothetical protein [Nitrososphaerota archaeon]
MTEEVIGEQYELITQTYQDIAPLDIFFSSTTHEKSLLYTLIATINKLNEKHPSFKINTEPLIKKGMELELKKLVAVRSENHTVITDIDRIEEFEPQNHSFCLYWIVSGPVKQQEPVFQLVEHEIYDFAKDNKKILTVLLDFNHEPITIKKMMEIYGITGLPVMIISYVNILNGIKELKRNKVVIIESEGIRRLVNQEKFDNFINNLPVWAELGTLLDKASWDGNKMPAIRDIYNEIKQFVRFKA